jgi:hypothetical protein
MSKECKCIKDYTVKARKYIGGGNAKPIDNHSNVYDMILFADGMSYYYFLRDDIYYVANKKEYLRHISKYEDSIEEFDEEEFFKYFELNKFKYSEY